MSRKSEFQSQNPNPATKFMEWKSNDKNFSYYDKENQKNIAVPLPFKFLTLMEMHTVKGWSDASESAIYSNEVKFISTEPLQVKSFKGGKIASGLYKEIKHDVKNAGGHYTKSIYAMLEDGTIVNFQLKGSSVREWGEFTKKSRSRLSDEWVEVTEAKDLKKGSIKYSVPVFLYNTSLNDSQADQADLCYSTLLDYMKKYVGSNNTPEVDVEDIEVEVEEVEADLAGLDL